MHPRERNSKRSTHHQWSAFPTNAAQVTHLPHILPRYVLYIYMFLGRQVRDLEHVQRHARVLVLRVPLVLPRELVQPSL